MSLFSSLLPTLGTVAGAYFGGPAGAAAIIQRLLITGVSLVLGLAAYRAIHRRLHLGGVFQLVNAASPGRQHPARLAPTL